MKLRLAAASLLLVLVAGACSSENPLAPRTRPSQPVKEETGNWMGSGH